MESCHPKEPKVVEWIHQSAVQKAQKAQERAEEERNLSIFACFGFADLTLFPHIPIDGNIHSLPLFETCAIQSR